MITTIYREVKKGTNKKDICALLGVGKTAFYDWMRIGTSDADNNTDSLFAELVNATRKGEAEFKRRHIALITRASNNGSWQASAWLLERKYPTEFGRHEQVKISEPDSCVLCRKKPTIAEFNAMIDALHDLDQQREVRKMATSTPMTPPRAQESPVDEDIDDLVPYTGDGDEEEDHA